MRITPILSSAILLCAGSLAACSDSPTSDTRPTPTRLDGQPIESSPGDSSTCANPEMDLADTHFGAWMPSGMLPTTDKDHWFEFRLKDNHFDPCAELSWVTLTGVSQPLDRPDPMAWESPNALVVFFHDGELIDDQVSHIFAGIESVSASDSQTAEVAYQNGGSIEGERVPGGKTVYSLDGDKLNKVDEPEAGSLSVIYDVSPLPGDNRVTPAGNLNHQPWDSETEFSDGTLEFVPMGDARLRCAFGGSAKSDVLCDIIDGAQFPLLSTFDAIKPTSTGGTGHANQVAISFSPPAHAVTNWYGIGNIPAGNNITDESVTKVGHIFIDTRGDSVIVSDATHSFRLADGVVEEVDPVVSVEGPDQEFLDSLRSWSDPR